MGPQRIRSAPVAATLADLAEQCLKKVPNHGPSSARVGNACIRVLARLPGTAPVAQLGRLRTRVKYAVGVQLVERALTEAAARAGLTPEELEEIAVPTFGLDAAGRLRRSVGGFVAEVRITGTDDVGLSWLSSEGRPKNSVPAAVREGHATELDQLKKSDQGHRDASGRSEISSRTPARIGPRDPARNLA